jgi:hypothetical protein
MIVNIGSIKEDDQNEERTCLDKLKAIEVSMIPIFYSLIENQPNNGFQQ